MKRLLPVLASIAIFSVFTNKAVAQCTTVASFTLNPSQGCAVPQTVFFTDQSSFPDTWSWNFGDGNTSTSQNPIHNYTIPGAYTVTLTIVDTMNGCTDFTTMSVFISAATADFSGSSLFGCGPLSVNFTDGSSVAGPGNIVSWDWNFGDGNSSTNQNPTHIYEAPEVYTVTLTTTLDNGCTNTRTRTNYVQVIGPDVNFGVTPGSSTFGDVPFSVNFADSTVSGAPITSWSWNFGDGGTSNQQNPNYTYTAIGVYDVSLEVTDLDGCSRSFTRNGFIEVAGPLCQDLTVQLDGTGNYNFLLGSTSPQVDVNQVTPSGIFNGTSVWQSFFPVMDGVLYSGTILFSATYTPTTSTTVNIYSGQGTGGTLLASTSYSTTFTSGPAEFILDQTVDVVSGNEYTIEIVDDNGDVMQIRKGTSYTGTAGGVGSITAADDLAFSTKILQRPDIDNGSTAAAGIASFDVDVTSFDCSNIGPNTVTLTVTDNEANTSTCSSTVTVEDNEAPVANCITTTPTLSLDGLGDVQVVDADINDGSSDNCGFTLSLDNEFFDCTDIGIQTVNLTVTDPSSNSSSCSATVEIVDNSAPTAVCQDHTLVLDGSGNATLTLGDVDNGSSDNCGIATRTLSETTYTCGNLGSNTVTLTVNDVNGNSASCTATVTVLDNQAPAITCPADIVVCSTDNSGSLISYIEPSGTDNCSVTTNQTDGSNLTNGQVFPIGTTVQTWTATDGTNSTSCSFNVTVDAKPIADFSFTPTCEGESTFFTDESTIDPSTSITSWAWDMGDGSSSIGSVDPIHAFGDTGMYDVELVVITPEGCSDTATQTVHVTPVPTADFTFTTACEGSATVFTNASTIDAGNLNYSWNFGDGTPASTDADPSHVYASNGTYTVTLTVTSDNGCEDVSTASVEVFDSPTALFTASTECFGAATEFTNLSTGAGTLDYSWDFGDSNSSTDANPTHTYANAGSFTAVLTVTNSNLCVSTHTVTVTVNELPTVDFSFSDVCEGTPATFTNASTTGTNNWDLGDGASSTLTNVSHVYSTFGSYDVTLTVTDANFCINSLTQTIEIFDLPDFTLTPTDVLCFGEATGQLVAVAVPPAATPWTLSIDGNTPVSTVTFGGLEAGTYDITAFDANGCEFTVSGTVNQPTDTLGIQVNNLVDILCHGETTGTININGTGGTGPYLYSVDGNPTQPLGVFSGLDAGDHDIQIIDFNACVFDTTITLNEPDTLVLGLVTANDLLCNGDNSGNVTVSATGGVGSYTFNIDGGTYDTPALFDNLAAGTYIIGVLDGNGCTDTLHVTLTEPGILQLSLINAEDALCFESSNGSIEVSAASGTAPYQYSIDGVSFTGSGLFQGLSAGTYTVTVMDANGCLDDLTETVFEPSELTIETNSSPVGCFGDATGDIEIVADGGTTDYEYSIDGGVTYFTNGGVFADLTADEYLAVVRDDNGCTASEGVVISQPSAAFVLSANVTDVACLGDATGSALLVGNGGTPTYLYSEDNINFVSSNVLGGFAEGTYMVYARDLNGCSDSTEITVGQPATAVSIANILTSNPACPNEASGAVTVQAAGGTPGYTYSSNGGTTFQSGQILSGIGGGGHLIVVQDANGCNAEQVVTLVSPPLLELTLDSIVNIDCEGDFDGELYLLASGGTPYYSYRLNNGNLQSNGDFLNLTDNDYVVSIMDVNGCMYSETFTVEAAQLQPVADFDFTVSGNAILFNNNSQFGDAYLWEFGDDSTSTEASPVHVYNEPGDYVVTLTVSNACGSNSVTINLSTINTGIEDEELASFNLYPNPTSNELYIKSNRAIAENLQLEIISIAGQLISSEQIVSLEANQQQLVDVSGLAQGVYYLRVASDKAQSVYRFDIIK